MKDIYLITKDSLRIANQERSIEMLESRLAQASDTIHNQEIIISSIGIYIAIASILIPILATAFTYYKAIKPAQDALKDFNKTTDEKIKNYLLHKESEEINAAIEIVGSRDIHKNSEAVMFLMQLSNEKFSKQHIEKMLEHVKSLPYSEIPRSNITYVVSKRITFNNSEFFGNILKKGLVENEDNHARIAIQYFSKDEIQHEALKIFKNFVNQTSALHKWSAYIMVTCDPPKHLDLLQKLLNDTKLIDTVLNMILEDGMINNFMELPYKNLKKYYPEVDFSEYYFFQKIKQKYGYEIPIIEN